MKSRSAAFALLLCLTFTGPMARAQQQATVELFSPQGKVKQVRQIKARFSEAMVPFGDPRAAGEPFVADCAPKGKGRWVDARNWVYDLDEDLPAGVRCEFKLREGLKTLSGKDVEGPRSFPFSTGGPAIITSMPSGGDEEIDEEQAFLLQLDGPATEESILRNVYFRVEGISDRIGVRILTAKEREPILRAQYGDSKETLDKALENRQAFPILQAKQRFPSGTRISLVWGKGVASAAGIATEEDQILPFATREPFTAGFNCSRENAQAECVPITPLRITFSAPIAMSVAKKIVLKGPGGKHWAPSFKVEESEDERLVSAAIFQGPFPEKSAFTIELPPGIRDDAGRRLSNAGQFPMTVRTDEYPPLAKFAADFGILELKGDPVLPVTLRNVEPAVAARTLEVPPGEEGAEPPKPVQEGQAPAKPSGRGSVSGTMTGRVFKVPKDNTTRMMEWIEAIRRRSWEDRDKSIFGHLAPDKTRKISIPKLEGARAFEVVGIPFKSPGFYVVEIESELLGAALLGESKPMYVATSVLVTNLAVHFKWGGDSSIVWVTTLDEAKPAPAAELQIRNCEGGLVWEGRTDKDGLARVENLPRSLRQMRCSQGGIESGLLVSARLNDDLAFVHSGWDDGIEPWRFQVPTEWDARDIITRTVLDRSLFRAGETVHMKHIARKHRTAGLALPAPAEYDTSLIIEHMGSNQQYEMPLKWDARGIAESTWVIPKEAKLGEYRLLTRKRGGKGVWSPPTAEFRVEEFRVPLMKGVIRPPSEPLVTPASVPIDLTVAYLGGGPAGLLPARFRYAVRKKQAPPPDGFEGFYFSSGKVKEGISRGGFREEEEDKTEINRSDFTLDKSGSLRTVVTKLPRIDTPHEIQAELEFRDPSGEVQTVSSRIPLWPARRLIGIKIDGWTLSKETVRFQVAVTDLSGRPAADAAVRVDLLQQKTYSHRRRLIGGFYAYEHSTEIKKVGTQCSGRTDRRGLLFCEGASPVSGNIILQAVTQDDSGREAATTGSAWIAGKSEWWFKAEDGDRIDLVPEKKRYEPGETVRLQVRMPFRKATALISIEREGVGDTFVREITGKEPVIEIPVKGNYAPNVFVSALVVRGRAGDVQPTATVDLGRPSFKLGIAEIRVGWKANELKVRVAPERPVYKVREKAKVTVSVTTPGGQPPARGAEVAIAAVDEGLLELMPNNTWQLLEGMMDRRAYDVQTSTAQMHVVGKRHFGLKALPQGGGGGRQATRELFDTLLFWKGRVQLDARGTAAVEIPLNDSLTAFRIVAVATAGASRFGTGAASIRATQDLMIFSGIPPVVRQGDKVRPEFTLRNAGERPLEVRVAARIRETGESLAPANLSLAAGESKVTGWDITVPAGADALHYELEAAAGEGIADRISVAQKVVPAVPTRVFQATLAQVEGEMRVEVERPPDALPGRGGIEVVLRPSLLDGLTGVLDYMRRYPYSCLEQDVSKAVATRDAAGWERILKRLPTYLDGEGLAKYWPSMRQGSDTLTAYLMAIAHEAGWQIPEGPRQQMLSGLLAFAQGKIVRDSRLPAADLSIRKLAAIEALSRYAGPAQPVPQAAAAGAIRVDAGLLASISLEPNLWPTSAVIDWLNILRRMPSIRDRDQRVLEAEQILRSRLNLQGTTMGFSTETSDSLWWLMVTADVNAVRLLLAEMDSPSWREDLPRIMRGALGRQRRGRWDTTVANSWGVLAAEKFAKAYEKEAVTGTSSAALAGRIQGHDWKESPAGKTLLFDWPMQRSTLSVSGGAPGRPWATVQSVAAIPLREPVSSGFKIKRTVTAVEQKEPGAWNRGDILRVRLELESQSDMAWVVVSDPIPAGAAILGTGLGRDSQLAAQSREAQGWVWPVFEERSFETYRAYYDFVPKGGWTIEYTLRLNAAGTMHLPVTRVEAMYSPEMFGEIPNEPVRIK